MDSRFHLISAKSPKDLDTKVNSALNSGWELCGMAWSESGMFYQTVERKTKNKSLAVETNK